MYMCIHIYIYIYIYISFIYDNPADLPAEDELQLHVVERLDEALGRDQPPYPGHVKTWLE